MKCSNNFNIFHCISLCDRIRGIEAKISDKILISNAIKNHKSSPIFCIYPLQFSHPHRKIKNITKFRFQKEYLRHYFGPNSQVCLRDFNFVTATKKQINAIFFHKKLNLGPSLNIFKLRLCEENMTYTIGSLFDLQERTIPDSQDSSGNSFWQFSQLSVY